MTEQTIRQGTAIVFDRYSGRRETVREIGRSKRDAEARAFSKATKLAQARNEAEGDFRFSPIRVYTLGGSL